MRFTVVWKADAERELASIWLAASQRNVVSQTAAEIERLLAASPEEAGESRGGDYRILFIMPLGVIYHLAIADRLVSVLRVWAIE